MLFGKYNKKAEAERRNRDTPEKILQIAKQKGEFTVSLRYRDDWLRKRCRKLIDAGLLKGGKRRDRVLVFYPVTNK